MSGLIRNLAATAILCGLVLLGYWWMTIDQQKKALKELAILNEQLEQNLAMRQAMIERLSRARRIAHVRITDQIAGESGAIDRTSLEFIELDDGGAELARQTFTIPGDVLFVDAWTIKFDAERVAEGNPLLGHTLVLLRRIYSDRQAPKDGFLIDTPGAIPPGYAASDAGRFEKTLWENFWTLAMNADQARDLGVRVAQGEAVYKAVRAGQTYELVVDAAGGMSLTPMTATPNTPALTRVRD